MIIQKQYKFYAAHRNEQLLDKCRNLHGHRYGLVCFFEVERDGALSTLFGDFDDKIEPLIKELPMEYAVEMNRLIELQMEGSVG